MGPAISKAKNSSDTLNDIVSDTILSSTQICTSSNGTTLTLDFSDFRAGRDIVFDGINQSANITHNFSCLQDSTQNATMQTKIFEKLEQAAKAAAESGIGISAAVSENITQSVGKIKSNFNLSQVATCVANNTQSLFQEYKRLNAGRDIRISNLSQAIIVNQITKCIQSNSAVTEQLVALDKLTGQTSESEAKGMNLLSLFLMPILIGIGVIFLLFAGPSLLKIMNKQDSKV
uniref:Uncharacterized protein n=1 Tax=viral metagenome TaxID=1070528 RepID=A0A6C0I181_9ZZZZ